MSLFCMLLINAFDDHVQTRSSPTMLSNKAVCMTVAMVVTAHQHMYCECAGTGLPTGKGISPFMNEMQASLIEEAMMPHTHCCTAY